MDRRIGFIAAPALAASLALAAWGEATMPSSVNGAGGGRVSDALHILSCTAGQAAVGSAGDANYDEYIGFWYPAGYQYAAVPDASSGIPDAFALRYAGSHPARSGAALICALPVAGPVSVRLHDVTGRVVQTLLEGTWPAGYHLLQLRASGLSGGVYFCRMDAPRFTSTRRLVLVR